MLSQLVELTGHDVRDTPPATRDERHAAIDRWSAWWKREGETAFLSRHPAVRDVTAERKIELGDAALARLPPLVSVGDASADVPVSFDVPRQAPAAPIRDGQIAASEDSRGQAAFRFTSPDAALAWFDSAGPVPADDPAQAALAPAMLQTRGLTRPESRGGVWCSWDRALTPTAVFDQRRWQTFSEPLPPGRISVFAGGNGEMLFQDRNHRFHLFDDAGHVQAASPVQLLEQHADRVRRRLGLPARQQQLFLQPLHQGRPWPNLVVELGAGVGGAVDGRQVILAAGAIAAVDVKPGHRHELLFPLGDDGRVIVCDGFSTGGRGVVAEVADGKIRRVADLPIMHVEGQQTGAMAVRDRQGRVWIAVRGGSRGSTRRARSSPSIVGRFCWPTGPAPCGSMWPTPTALRWRWDRTAKKPSSRCRNSGAFRASTESPLGVFWAISGKELVAIHFDGSKLALGQRILAPWSDYHWCDPAGRVWLTFGNNTGEAICLAVSKPLAN